MPFLTDMFSRDLGALSRLDEAVNYGEMFNDWFRFAQENGLDSQSDMISTVINTARQVLKKNDRVVWFVRWFKVGFVSSLGAVVKTPAEAQAMAVQEFQKRSLTDLSNKLGKAPAALVAASIGGESHNANELVMTARRAIDNLEHFLSLPIHAIQTTVFARQTPGEIADAFEAAETKWKEEAEDAFNEVDPKVKAIITFPDGFAWYNLDKAYCSKEADSMGHCGNEPRKNSDDTILSLRKTIQRGDKALVKPYATFILDSDGLLGEMKGRFNEKPGPELHPYIVALLKDNIVKGIKGGGYMPQNNFSMRDLGNEEREALLDDKPELGSVEDMVRIYGINSSRATSAINNALYEKGIRTSWSALDNGSIEIENWSNLGDFVDDIDDYFVGKMISFIDGDDDDQEEIETLSTSDVQDVIDRMETPVYVKLMNRLGLKPVPHNSRDYPRALTAAADLVTQSEFADDLLDAMNRGLKASEAAKAAVLERLKEYVEEGWSFSSYSVYAVVDEDDPVNKPVSLRISADDFVAILSAEEGDEYDDSSYELDRVREYGWSGLDSDNMAEKRRENKMVLSGYNPDLDEDKVLKAKLGSVLGDMDFHQIARDFAKRAGL